MNQQVMLTNHVLPSTDEPVGVKVGDAVIQNSTHENLLGM